MTTPEHSPSAGEMSERTELLAKFTEWARQVAAREDVPRGIRNAAAGLADEGRRAAAPAAQPVEQSDDARDAALTLKERLNQYQRDESGRTLAEVVYWRQQYKQLAADAIAALSKSTERP